MNPGGPLRTDRMRAGIAPLRPGRAGDPAPCLWMGSGCGPRWSRAAGGGHPRKWVTEGNGWHVRTAAEHPHVPKEGRHADDRHDHPAADGAGGRLRDARTDTRRRDARAWLRAAVEADVSASLSRHAEPVDDRGRRVRHGHPPERDVMTGRVRPRAGSGSPRPSSHPVSARRRRPGADPPALPHDGSDRERPCRSAEPDPQDPGRPGPQDSTRHGPGLMMAAKADRRRLPGHRAAVIEGIECRDGIRQMKDAA